MLQQLSDELGSASRSAARLVSLTNTFFSLIPHSFGRSRPPVIDSPAKLKEKLDMVAVSTAKRHSEHTAPNACCTRDPNHRATSRRLERSSHS